MAVLGHQPTMVLRLVPTASQARPQSAALRAAPGSLLQANLAWGCSVASEEPSVQLIGLRTFAPLLAAAAAVAAGRRGRGGATGRRCRVRVARAAAEEDREVAEELGLAERLEAKLSALRDRERKLIERIEAVQTTIVEVGEASTDESAPEEVVPEPEAAAAEEAPEPSKEEPAEEPTADVESAEAKEVVEEPQAAAETAPEPVAEEVVEELQAAAQAPPEPAAEAYSQVEEETFKELRILENLADAHEDITKREIKALEQLAGSKEGNKLMLGLREAGARLREKVDAEFREMRRREAALLNSITATADEIAKVEKEEPLPMKASKAIKELRMLEQLAHAYEDTTAEEIKALEQFAKEDQS